MFMSGCLSTAEVNLIQNSPSGVRSQLRSENLSVELFCEELNVVWFEVQFRHFMKLL